MKLADLDITVDRTAYRGFFILVLIPILVIVGYTTLFRTAELTMNTVIAALVVGVCFAVYHEIAQIVHQLGHALAARATGYPMQGIRYAWVFTFSEYPPNEPALPESVHITRSLGGVGGTALMLVIAGVLWNSIGRTATGLTNWVLTALLVDSVLLFIASAVLSDGLLFILRKPWNATEADAKRGP